MENFKMTNAQEDLVKGVEKNAVEGEALVNQDNDLEGRLNETLEEFREVRGEIGGFISDLAERFGHAKLAGIEEFDEIDGIEDVDYSKFPADMHDSVRTLDKMMKILVPLEDEVEDLRTQLDVRKQVETNLAEKSDIQRVAEIKDRVAEIDLENTTKDSQGAKETVTEINQEANEEVLKVLASMEDDMTKVNAQGEQII